MRQSQFLTPTQIVLFISGYQIKHIHLIPEVATVEMITGATSGQREEMHFPLLIKYEMWFVPYFPEHPSQMHPLHFDMIGMT